ncbi:two-component system, NtrC family, sensor histidine kinase [Thermotomaculum hydrothermale]|uniref:histidine kinase n=1 Tax=Thermotomaculum hydrothermale TaxID=981385 RepID=A0A7R6PKZ7_9BACT|nr:ATP-binding protein [Thermotomaculum hydrothermale]BBB32047.1 two-component system, NtrC family, sensor histidine kinase [Thermotomaculum hydrothermale]
MDYERLKTLIIGSLVFVGFLFVAFILIVRKLKREFESSKVVEPDDVFYQNLKTALEKQHALTEEVKRKERFQKTVLDNISVGVAVFDRYKKLRDSNSFFRKLFSIDENSNGKTIVELGFPEGFVEFVKSINFSMLFQPFEKQLNLKEKVLLIRVSKIQFMTDAEGILLLIHDITELENAKKKLELRNRLEYIGEMSANMAHEFKNAISTVKGYAQMILTGENDDKSLKYAEKILKESENINEVVNRFLLYAKPLNISLENIDAKEFLNKIESKFEDKEYVDFLFESENFVFKGDRVLLRQCFENLILNSIESVRGNDNPSVKVFLKKSENGEVIFRVVDNGKGIPEDEITKVFVPFFTTKSEGTGLGLAICEKIIAKHNGSIEIKSEQGIGTEVIVRL